MKNLMVFLLVIFWSSVALADTAPISKFSSPLSRSGGTVSIPAATSSTDGYLAHGDWSNFNNKAFVFNVKTYGAAGNGTTDDTTPVNAAFSAASAAGGGIIYFPAGTYKITSTLTMVLKTTVRGDGPAVSIINFTGTGDGLRLSSTVNSSTAVNTQVIDIALHSTNGSNTGGGYDDIGGTFVTLRNVTISGFKYGVIFDQTELADILSCQLVGNTTGQVWLVNDNSHTGGANGGFTNRISVQRSQISPGAGSYGIIDDGGTAHTFQDNNYNGGVTHIVSAGGNSLNIIGGEFESASSTNITFSNITFGGTAVGQGVSANIIGASFTPTSGNNVIFTTSQGSLSVISNIFGGSATPSIAGLNNTFGFFGFANEGISYSGTATQASFTNDNANAASFAGNVLFPGLTASKAMVLDSTHKVATITYTNSNTISSLVERDGSGNFSAGTITAALQGNATTATTASNIAGGTTGQVLVQTGAATTGFYTPAGNGGSSTFTPNLAINTTPQDCVALGLALTSSATNATFTAFCYQQGHYLEIDGKILWSAQGGTGNVTVSIASMTGSPVIDSSVLPGGTATTTAGSSRLGWGSFWNNTSFNAAVPIWNTNKTIIFGGGGVFLAGSTISAVWSIDFHAHIPIVGW